MGSSACTMIGELDGMVVGEPGPSTKESSQAVFVLLEV